MNETRSPQEFVDDLIADGDMKTLRVLALESFDRDRLAADGAALVQAVMAIPGHSGPCDSYGLCAVCHAKSHCVGSHVPGAEILEDVKDAEAKAERLAAELAEVLEYAGHTFRCNGMLGPCDCGWSAMREKWREGKG